MIISENHLNQNLLISDEQDFSKKQTFSEPSTQIPLSEELKENNQNIYLEDDSLLNPKYTF